MTNKDLYNKILNGDIPSQESDNVESLGYPIVDSVETNAYLGSNAILKTAWCEDTVDVPNSSHFSASVLIIGGGGGGGQRLAGAGGGGGYREFTKKFFTNISYTVTVGAGGSGSTSDSVAGSDGSNSSIERIAHGGGGGGSVFTQQTGRDGGSGGGSSANDLSNAGSSISPRCNGSSQGNAGGVGYKTAINYRGGGGGGASASGATGQASGDGGDGKTSTITGSSATYAGGGGGGGYNTSQLPAGSGGAGGGGNGSDTWNGTAANSAGDNGTVNTGGGGGGGTQQISFPYTGANGGNGGSGFVVIKFPDTYSITIGGGLTYTSSTSGGYTTVQFTAGTDTVSFHSDPYYNNTVLILQDSFSDESPENQTITVGSTVRLSSTAKVGQYSIESYGNGTTNRLLLPTDSSLTIGTSADFTLEFWVKYNSQDFYGILLSTAGTSAKGSVVCSPNTSFLMRFTTRDASNNANILYSTTNISNGSWHHVAVTRNSGYLRLFINGTLEDSNASHTDDIDYSGAAFFDWLGNTFSDNEVLGHIDALRITKGVARYTSNFTPSTSRYI